MADITSPIAGNVWKIQVYVGQSVAEGDVVVILESMKTEISIEAEASGEVREIRCQEGRFVPEGEILIVLA